MNKKIVKFEEYKGKYVYYQGGDYPIEVDGELEDIIEEIILEKEEPEIYANGAETYLYGGLDIIDTLQDNHYDDGYDEINGQLNYKSDKLVQAQKLVDEWLKENESTRTCYTENCKELIDLSELIEQVRTKMSKENE